MTDLAPSDLIPPVTVLRRALRLGGRYVPWLRLGRDGLPFVARLRPRVVVRVLRIALPLAGALVVALLRGFIGVLLLGQRLPLLLARRGSAANSRRKQDRPSN